MSGSLSAQSGQGSVVAAELAIEDCLARECKGMYIDVLSADHQNKPDVAVGIVRKWIDVDGVNAVTDIIQAAVQLAVQSVMAEKNRIALFPGGTARLANEACAPATSVLWMWDTYGQAVGIARPLAKPGSKWFMIAADYAFGQQLVADATGAGREGGRTGDRLGAAPVQLRRRLLALPDPGAGLGRRRDRARQHRDRPDQHPQGRRRNSASAQTASRSWRASC